MTPIVPGIRLMAFGFSLLILPLGCGASSGGKSACTSSESWSLAAEVPTEWRTDFQGFLNKKISPARGFSEALAMRRFTRSAESRLLGEYWISRSLYEAGLVHIAYNGFAQIASYPVSSEGVGIQTAALECLTRIHERFPSFPLPPALTAQGRLPDFLAKGQTAQGRQVIWEFASALLRTQLADAKNTTENPVTSTLALLQGSGAHETFARALLAARRNDPTGVIAQLARHLHGTAAEQQHAPLPEPIKKYENQARLLLARSYYSTGQFDKGASQLRLISKSSNELAEALSELSWQYLLSERYPDAIGTAMSMQAGGMRRTFTPEALMVMGMALNELCQYPESLKAIASFRRGFEKPYLWLKDWETKSDQPLYPVAIKFLRKQTQLPERIGSEWLRSPVFISHQDEINQLFESKDASAALGRAAAREHKRLVLDIRKAAGELKVKIRTARIKAKPGTPLPDTIKSDLAALKQQLLLFKRMQAAAPVWRAVLGNHQRQAPAIERRLIAGINRDLSERSLRMLLSLEEIAENNQLIEVEIYNGASQDIIWQNAHPDYKELAKHFNQDVRDGEEKVWDWGRAPATTEEGGEIWEDELGSFKASLFDNCSNREKYIAIKRRAA